MISWIETIPSSHVMWTSFESLVRSIDRDGYRIRLLLAEFTLATTGKPEQEICVKGDAHQLVIMLIDEINADQWELKIVMIDLQSAKKAGAWVISEYHEEKLSLLTAV